MQLLSTHIAISSSLQPSKRAASAGVVWVTGELVRGSPAAQALNSRHAAGSKAIRVICVAMNVVKFLLAGVCGAVLAAFIAVVLVLNNRPDLSIWHTVELDEEFSTDANVQDFAEYLALEDRLFNQLDSLVYDKVPTDAHIVNRYSRGSRSDPHNQPVNWNRTFELEQTNPAAGVLLLHGLSDSPYSLRALGKSLHSHGATVLGLRIPGHGTAPSGLVDIRWQDMAAAVRLAAQHLRETVGDKPLYLVGYSNGGALAIDYIIDALENQALPAVNGVLLLAPEIGVSSSAAFAVWQGRLGRALGLDKLAWVSIGPEYDPYKYTSFAINAGDLAYRITAHIQAQLGRFGDGDALDRLPPILAFQSGVDSTITASALVSNLFAKLPQGDHELVLFDINRSAALGGFLKHDPREVFVPLLQDRDRPYTLTVVSNSGQGDNRVVAITEPAGADSEVTQVFLNDWPRGIYSLSHVALPFPPDDPIYGGPDADANRRINLGNLALRGERGVLHITPNDMLRLRWNPFFDYVEDRVLSFVELQDLQAETN